MESNNQQHMVPFCPLDCSIEDEGVTSLSEALKTNTTLTKLDLSGEDKLNTQTQHNVHFFTVIQFDRYRFYRWRRKKPVQSTADEFNTHWIEFGR